MTEASKEAAIDLDSISPKPTKTFHKQTYSRIDPTKSGFKGAGKTVLITAGATGVGFEISKAFAQTGVKRIIVVSRRTEPQEKAKKALEAEFPNLAVEGVRASVTDYPRITEILQNAGAIDVLVMSHAAAHDMTLPSASADLSEIQTTFDTNVIAPMHLVQQYLKSPTPAAGPKTVIYVSTASAHLSLPGQIGYGGSKTAFSRMLGDYFGAETGPKEGVRMFSYHPGAFYTEAAAAYGVPENAMEWEDIKLPAHFAVWLASSEADFLHGRFLWAHWDVEDMIKDFPSRLEKDPGFLKFGVKF